MGIPDFCPASPQNIPLGQSVAISRPTTLDCAKVEGSLTVNSALTVRTLYGNGTLTVNDGASITFVSQTIDTATDPERWGHGLIWYGGVVRMNGTPKTPFVRLTAEVRAGQAFTPPSVAGWLAGDSLVLPDSRQSRTDSQSERLVSGQAAQFDHKGARWPDGTLKFLPHVANLSRGIVIRSANPNGVRGHLAFIGRTNVDIRGVEFRDLGRTEAQLLDCTLRTTGAVQASRVRPTCTVGTGPVTHIGTNQAGRYAVHFHHLIGPVSPQANGKQFTFIGNSIQGNRKWGVALHNSHWGLVQNNVCAFGKGACYVTEDGSETANEFLGNIAIGINHFGEPLEFEDLDFSRGSGFALKSVNTIVRQNVVADSREAYNYLPCAGEGDCTIVNVPRAQGLDTHDPANVTPTNIVLRPRLANDGNEAYAATQYLLGLWISGVVAEAPVTNFTGWHAMPGPSPFHIAFFGKYTDFDVDGLTLVNEGGLGFAIGQFNPSFSVTSTPPTRPSRISNADVRGFEFGRVKTGQLGEAGSQHQITDSVFQVKTGIVIHNSGQRTMQDADGVSRPKFLLSNLRFVALRNERLQSIKTQWFAGELPREITIEVTSYQGTASDTFKVYIPNGQPASPCSTTRPEIVGFVCGA
jgi:parallel beta-helix repeat protein